MSKASQRNMASARHVPSQGQKTTSRAKQQARKKFVVSGVIIILAAIPFGLGKYFEFNSPDPFDGGGYVYSAKHILDGAKIGVGENPSAQSGTLLVNMLGVRLSGFNETGAKFIQTILQAAALTLMFAAMRKLFGTLPAAIGVIVASIYLSAPLIAKFGNVKEQYMIAFMAMGVSCFVLHQLKPGGLWWCAILCGAFLAWAPLFKQTGVSAAIATGLFVIAQPLLKHRSWKQTAIDVGLLSVGAVLGLAPLYTWLAAAKAPVDYWPYAFALKIFSTGTVAATGPYISDSRKFQGLWEQCPRVLRYYTLLILPIALAAGAIIARIIRIILVKFAQSKETTGKSYDRFVLFFAVWWLLDMVFVWISPRSYEQYYLPLNASAAMLGGYLIAIYCDAQRTSVNKIKWNLIGAAGFVCMIIMSWHIFFGIKKSPHSGLAYEGKKRGYAQKWDEISKRRNKDMTGAWEVVGDYIRKHSATTDKIYVWGWYPGIYVRAQRMCSSATAFTSEMHVMSPQALSELITELLGVFEKQPPKFIVDSRKIHFPWDRPLLELWPSTKKGFLPNNKEAIDEYDATHSKMLREKIDPDEALRYEAMRPFREFIRKNYKIAGVFSEHILFEHL